LLGAEVTKVKEKGHFEVVIRNTNSKDCNACDYNIWVRVTGTEIIAGKAKPDADKCRWTFSFQIHQAGVFTVQSKLISYLGAADIEYDTCKRQRGRFPDFLSEWTPREFTGFKFYKPYLQCCDVCSKQDDCTHWLSGGGIKAHCHFFNLNDNSTRRESSLNVYSGTVMQGESRPYVGSIFLGCGWSYELASEHPCIDNANDDRIPFIEEAITVSHDNTVVAEIESKALPICSLDHRVNGRWVDVKEKVKCSKVEDDSKFEKRFPIQRFARTDLGVCWFRENVNAISSRCLEGGCNALKKSSRWRDSSFIRKVNSSDYWGTWVPYEKCRYHLLTSSDLQKCVTKKKISSITTIGVSIAKFLRVYVNQRNEDIQLHRGSDGVQVEINTLKLPHLIWHESYKTIKDEFERFEAADATTLKYFLSGMYISSEREAHVLDDHASYVSDTISSPILKGKGWKEVYWHDISAAFTYDSATQGDGLHVVGVPMKQIWTMVMNDICNDVL